MEFLNGQFERDDVYFREAMQLLSDFNWIYKSRNTDILADGILHFIPDDWIPILQLNCFENIQMVIKGEINPSWPLDLTKFAVSCWRLSLRINLARKEEALSKWKKVNPKKIHEVVNFSLLIGEKCAEKDIKHVVDIGAGLGYLDKELSDRCDLHVLGLERDAYRVLAASQRATVDTPENVPNRCRAIFKELVVKSEDTLEDQIESVISNWFNELEAQHVPSPPLCMIGLHSCGDLSPIMMKLFMNIRHFHSLLLVSCCYHRMDWKKEPVDDNLFPISNSLKSNHCEPEGIQNLFRLAAQETPNHWIQQNTLNCQRQAQHTFYRSLVQLYANRGIQLLKQHRKPVKMQKTSVGFEEYVDQAIQAFSLPGQIADHRQKLLDIYYSNARLLPALETLIVLQVLLQPVAEALILVDRVVYLRENGINASLQQIFDDRISPRCFVTLAEKSKSS
ncbi:methyltransferase-like protein 25B isoform X2 [Daphnia carinata]|uniref:methyltransferase-like protein 25B isoform X2 n=1 Tax=Daphnia carinata TaxID=120202 RepID=UPI002868C060|nr:methyltransferase-like protein 25B isoform X2 [Daphnia carinata]